ncbi:MAG TPA: adenosylmethionine--8-amino-7-oxononanoate transaminase [Sandaracinaceae bacterium LLY-WYZ-13_1]|nr:adenosylmethionine--8-amino-7-oxononanoate transaminase [Sandaracinaceae bacterium LLY-WYZ-13_1]
MRLPPELSRADVVAKERAHVWPPYTSSERHERTDPLVIVGGEGAWIEDADGRRLIDGNGSWWTCTLGHGHPRLRRALTAQAEALMHVAAGGITHAPVALLAEELAAVAPEGLSRAHFSDDGSTAVEVAVKAAFQYWQQNGRPERTRFIALAGAYHGDTLGAASLAALDEFHHVFHPLLFEVIRPPDPEDAHGWERAVARIEDELAARPETIAGVVVEPLLQGAAGMRIWDAALLRRLREATHAADTFLIADEVFTGYGRTGAMWACELAGVVPDLLCVAKGFTAGVLPMAATLASERVYDGFRGGAERALMHGHTFCGNPLGAAVAREVLAIYRDEDVLGQVAERAPIVREAFERIGTVNGVHRSRSLGMMGAADLGEGGYAGQTGWRVFEAALRRGAFLRPLGDTVYVTPPLNVPLADLEQLLSIVEESVREVLA